MVFKHNRKQHILAIAVAFFAAAPAICLPIGVRAGASPGLTVSRAYANVFGEDDEDEGVIIEDWALIGSADEMQDADSDDGKPSDQTEKSTDYDDIPKFYVYQSYDTFNHPNELLAPEYFAPDNTQFYAKVAAALKTKPENSAPTVVSIHKGQPVVRTALGDTWSKVRTENGKEGYILTSYIQDTMVKVNSKFVVWCDTGSLTVRKEADSSAAKVTTVYKHARLYVTQIVGDKWYKITTANGKTGYVPKSYTTRKAPPTPTPSPTPRPTRKPVAKPTSKSKKNTTSKPKYGNVNKLPKITGKNGSSIVAIAQSMLGVKYKYAGASRNGIDCSGLVMYCYAQIGIRVPHGATQIWRRSGVSVPRSELKPGDVVCYSKGSICPHVAIYVGGSQVIHASDSKGKVCYGPIDMMKIKGYKRLIR